MIVPDVDFFPLRCFSFSFLSYFWKDSKPNQLSNDYRAKSLVAIFMIAWTTIGIVTINREFRW